MPSNHGLHRSVNPNHMDGEIVGIQAFSPTSNENHKLSVDCEKIWSAKSSYRFRTKTLGKLSNGIWTLPREIFEKLKLTVEVDKRVDNPAHSLVVFPTTDKAKRRDAARRLTASANAAAYSLLFFNEK